MNGVDRGEQRRWAAAVMLMWMVGVIVGLALGGALGGGDDPSPAPPETPSATVLEVDDSEVRVLCTEDGDRLYVATGPGGGTDVEVVPEALLEDGC